MIGLANFTHLVKAFSTNGNSVSGIYLEKERAILVRTIVTIKTIFILFSFVLVASAASIYQIGWHSLTGGGHSTGGVYSMTGTVGQMSVKGSSGGAYDLFSGFWSDPTGSPTSAVETSLITTVNTIPGPYWLLIILMLLCGSYLLLLRQRGSNDA